MRFENEEREEEGVRVRENEGEREIERNMRGRRERGGSERERERRRERPRVVNNDPGRERKRGRGRVSGGRRRGRRVDGGWDFKRNQFRVAVQSNVTPASGGVNVGRNSNFTLGPRRFRIPIRFAANRHKRHRTDTPWD